MFLEVIYETGTHSVMCVESLDEALEGLKNHHERAKSGGMASPGSNVPAQRIAKVLNYGDKHPNDFNMDQVVTDGEVKAAFTDALKSNSESGAVHLPSLLAELRNLTNPQVESGPHESNYKMKEAEEIEPKKWGGE